MISQDTFRGALLDAAQPVPEGLTDGAGRPAGRRYAVYRNNVAVSLREALATGFPAVRGLIGTRNFDGIAGMFLRAEPPASPLMMHYGAGFPAFLAGLEPLRKWPYLPDVARLELALRESYHAPDAPALTAADLAALPPEALEALRPRPAPSLRLLRSDWPVVSVYRFAMTQGAPKPQPVAETAVILRDGFDPAPHVLPPGGTAFLGALAEGLTLSEALDTAPEGTDLSPTLHLLLAFGGLTLPT